MMMRKKLAGLAGLTLTAGFVVSGCTVEEPIGCAVGSESPDAIVIGSQAYNSNEILAEIYAQALQNAGVEVRCQLQIGQRDAYLPQLESGELDLFPEYTGNLLQYYSPDTQAQKTDQVYAELATALPAGLTALAMSPATDQDSYNVTAEFAAANGLVSIADLAGVDGLILGGELELEERPYGPRGLLDTYGVTVSFDATGPATVDALLDGVINVANVYTGNPAIAEFGFVTLTDPEGLLLASNVVPIASTDIADSIASIINPVSLKLTPEGLVALNLRNTKDEVSAADVAAEWLAANGF